MSGASLIHEGQGDRFARNVLDVLGERPHARLWPNYEKAAAEAGLPIEHL
nr:hypothetical protein [Stenotrophomonas maltophilia]